jgi:hypothetical protein
MGAIVATSARGLDDGDVRVVEAVVVVVDAENVERSDGL